MSAKTGKRIQRDGWGGAGHLTGEIGSACCTIRLPARAFEKAGIAGPLAELPGRAGPRFSHKCLNETRHISGWREAAGRHAGLGS